MATLDSFLNNTQWPKGPYPTEVRAVCCKVEKGFSSKKRTPFVELFWTTEDGACFSDSIYITGKAVSRIAIVAHRVCGIPKNINLPENKDEAVIVLAKLVMEKVINCAAIVRVEEYEEEYIIQEGPDVGQPKKITKHQVSPFNGYRQIENKSSTTTSPDAPPPPSDADAPPADDEGQPFPF